VTAKIADGRVETGDVLIGADGIESMTRRHVVGDEAPRPVELTMWRANVALEENAMPPVDFEAFWGPGAKFVAFRSGPGQLSWEAIVASPPGGHDPPGESKRVVLERFAGFHKDEERIVGATPDGAVFRSDVFDRPPDPHWSSGRVALLGDAAHPMTFAVGQGAAQALEDALAIGDALADTTDVEAALRGYAARRAARAAHFQTLAYRLARLGGWQNPASWRFRNAMFKVMNPMGWRMQFKELPLPARPTP
jgi:2-polyprenyl-6-methoxyphenol hydroxylase-like FAD-dependent oxidoreductase